MDEIHKAKNGMCSQGRSVRQLNSKIRIGLSGTPMNKAEVSGISSHGSEWKREIIINSKIDTVSWEALMVIR